jgi:c(7)-type cytochrome triheme protein
MKIKYFYAVLTLCLISLLTIAAINSDNSNGTKKTNKDVIKFSHVFHKDLTDCASCHTAVAGSASMKDKLLPVMDVCATCHDVKDEKNCTQCHYENVYEPLIQPESKMIFNHKFHLEDQKLACEKCHKGLSDVAYSFESPGAKPVMETCYECHNGKSIAVISNCDQCHISTVNLIPENHKEVSFVKSHKFHANSENANCAMCHDNSFCESCHAGTTMITEKNSSRDFYVPYSPQKFIDNTKQQQMTRVHDLNYRYTHGIDAKGKSSECQTCHQSETFCAECHESKGGDFALEGNMPVSHKAADFVIPNIGSGGGQHAILAKRDVESCASCHDVEGADPVCLRCHMDFDGVKGTNPKTHTIGFMKDTHGEWHTDRGAVCFECHTDANAHPGGIKGIGFCGYCHK